MPIRTFAGLLEAAKAKGPKTVAVAAGHQAEVMLAGLDAEMAGLAEVILVGDADQIHAIARENSFDISRMEVVHAPQPREAAYQVMKLVSEGKADVAMKGKVETSDFLRAALSKELGLRTGRLFTHVAVFEIPEFDRLIFISDAGVVVAPDLEQKVEIVQNAILVAHGLQIQLPRVAVLAATEVVNPRIPTTLDAANLSKMADRGQIQGGLVDGPLALDNAISPESARIKGIKSEVAGYADILIAPDIEAGNVLAKAITYFAQGKMAGVVVGARCPLILPSRSDTREAKLVSLALGMMLAS
ncbi:MAG: bifunctional enoyl-CoA hydratase/phosphate acetyltransferase [Anaerolineaceae bacterium]|jgi:phosphate butyryltransferase|nr:bifunctional enoyl-CoA hydratase/phosphate acetyltransferase [Anaerolineae bacterium]MDX9829464.1 bifunctional enoyl-CoA hydratase/phosphate acetyltransferase [Anaerolineae bacterium]NLF11844.1 bifunctional enoyl-CoA hydratase/phosphate acetyltransferase [Anaerolineaceae bacterium]